MTKLSFLITSFVLWLLCWCCLSVAAAHTSTRHLQDNGNACSTSTTELIFSGLFLLKLKGRPDLWTEDDSQFLEDAITVAYGSCTTDDNFQAFYNVQNVTVSAPSLFGGLSDQVRDFSLPILIEIRTNLTRFEEEEHDSGGVKLFRQTERRSKIRALQEEDECGCPLPTKSTFIQNLSRRLEYNTGKVESITDIHETVAIQDEGVCPDEVSEFTAGLVIESIRTVDTLSPECLATIADSVASLYNNLNILNEDTCDLQFREINQALAVVDDDYSQDDEDNNDEDIVSILIRLDGLCRGCESSSKLFDSDGQRRAMLSDQGSISISSNSNSAVQASTTTSSSSVVQRHDRGLLPSDGCYCPAGATVEGAPTKADFFQAWQSEEVLLANDLSCIDFVTSIEEIRVFDCGGDVVQFVSYLEADFFGNVLKLTEEEILTLEATIMSLFEDLESRTCDPFLRSLLSVRTIRMGASDSTLSPSSTPSMSRSPSTTPSMVADPERRHLQDDNSTNIPSEAPSSSTQTEDPSFGPSSFPSGSTQPTNTASSGPTVRPTSEPTARGPDLFFLVFELTGQCRGCEANAGLFNDVLGREASGGGSGRRRLRLSELPPLGAGTRTGSSSSSSSWKHGGSRRLVEGSFETGGICGCGLDSPDGSVSEADFVVNLSDSLETLELPNIETLERVVEFEELPSETPSESGMPSVSPSMSLAPTNATASFLTSEILTPSEQPSGVPSGPPSEMPSRSPSSVPSAAPSEVPSRSPSSTPSITPSEVPSIRPTEYPSVKPSESPSTSPSLIPSGSPSSFPSEFPSEYPSVLPSGVPSTYPSHLPSSSILPSEIPSRLPSQSFVPSLSPSFGPSGSLAPSVLPSIEPSSKPSSYHSGAPSSLPSSFPSDSSSPSSAPSKVPSTSPSIFPSRLPSASPSDLPSFSPSRIPSRLPSLYPSSHPSLSPSSVPSSHPSTSPSSVPSRLPSKAPSSLPSWSPSSLPSTPPSNAPSILPSLSPTTSVPSNWPSKLPSAIPSSGPTGSPSVSLVPSASPTFPCVEMGSSAIQTFSFDDEFYLQDGNFKLNGQFPSVFVDRIPDRRRLIDKNEGGPTFVHPHRELRSDCARYADSNIDATEYRYLLFDEAPGSIVPYNIQVDCPDDIRVFVNIDVFDCDGNCVLSSLEYSGGMVTLNFAATSNTLFVVRFQLVNFADIAQSDLSWLHRLNAGCGTDACIQVDAPIIDTNAVNLPILDGGSFDVASAPGGVLPNDGNCPFLFDSHVFTRCESYFFEAVGLGSPLVEVTVSINTCPIDINGMVDPIVVVKVTNDQPSPPVVVLCSTISTDTSQTFTAVEGVVYTVSFELWTEFDSPFVGWDLEGVGTCPNSA